MKRVLAMSLAMLLMHPALAADTLRYVVLVKPLDYRPGQQYPTIVDLHGGPGGGVDLGFHPEWHWLAASSYGLLPG